MRISKNITALLLLLSLSGISPSATAGFYSGTTLKSELEASQSLAFGFTAGIAEAYEGTDT